MDFKNIAQNAMKNSDNLSATPNAPKTPSTPSSLNSGNSNNNNVLKSNNNITNDNSNSNLTEENKIDNKKNNSSTNEENKNDSNSDEKKQSNTNNKEINQQDSNQEVGPGKRIDENGNIVNKNSRKAVEAIGRGAAAYFSGGKSIGKDESITKSSIGDKTIGTVSDVLDKVPVANKALDEIGESGLADSVNEVLNTVGRAENLDIKGTIESAKKAKKDIDKTKKYYSRKMLYAVLGGVTCILFVCIIIIVICGPYLGGFLDVVNNVETTVGDTVDSISNYVNEIESYYDRTYNGTLQSSLTPDVAATTQTYINEIPNFENLSPLRKDILITAASGVASGRPYHIHSGENDPCWGKPTGPGINGIPTCGIDCSGFVQWTIWTATGNKPFSGGTWQMTHDYITNGTFIQIDESELLPGDIGVRSMNSTNNHTGIYAGTNGNGKKVWLHAESTRTGLQRNTYGGFRYFLRYKGVDAA